MHVPSREYIRLHTANQENTYQVRLKYCGESYPLCEIYMINSFEHVIRMFIYQAILYYYDSISGKANTYHSQTNKAFIFFVVQKWMTLFYIPMRIKKYISTLLTLLYNITLMEHKMIFYNILEFDNIQTFVRTSFQNNIFLAYFIGQKVVFVSRNVIFNNEMITA